MSKKTSNLDVNSIRAQFPLLKETVNGNPLIYFDNAATTQKPNAVIDAISNFYQHDNANVHRAVHTLGARATLAFEEVREKVQHFIHAKVPQECIFVRGTTEGINLVAQSFVAPRIEAGEGILITHMEHHSNIVPWQILAKKKRARLKYIPIDNQGRLNLKTLPQLLTAKTKLLSVAHISNVLGTINPIEKIIQAAHRKGAKILIDGAQAGAHVKIDVQKLDADFYVLSGHKMFGPTGVGVLYGKKELLETMPPYQSGGHMIKKVNLESSTWADLPHKFEAGTASIADVIGLGSAVDFINKVGIKRISNLESRITNYVLKEMLKIKNLEIYGPKDSKNRIGVISFNLRGIPPHDLASILDSKGIAVRTGHHCAMPLHDKLGIESSARISLAIYNTEQDIDKFMAGLKYAAKLLG